MSAEVCIVNKFETDCAACDERVLVGEGVSSKKTKRSPWRTHCKPCADRRGLRPKKT